MKRTPFALTPLRRGRRLKVRLESACGLHAVLDPAQLPPFPGGALDRLRLNADPSLLPAADAGRLLRLARRLLRSGGVLEHPDAGAAGPSAWDPDLLAWTCGFAADSAVEAAAPPALATRLRRTPVPAEPERPLVSIVIPAYKPEHFREALASALDQDYPRLEILVCDDSPDGRIKAIVDSFGGMRHKVRYLRNRGTLGGRANYLKGFREAWGDYVKFLNDDDVLAPDCVSTLAEALRAGPGVMLATSARRPVDADGRELPAQPYTEPLADRDALVPGEDLISVVLSTGLNRIGEPTTVLFRKADLADARPHLMSYWGRSALRNGDLTMWTALLSRGDAVVVARPLSDFRHHGNQFSHDADFRREAAAAWDILAADARASGLMRSAPRLDVGVVLGDPAALLAEAQASLAGGEPERAAVCAHRAAWLAPLRPEPRAVLARAHWAAGRPGPALLGLAYAADGLGRPRLAALLAELLEAGGHAAAARTARAAAARAVPSPS